MGKVMSSNKFSKWDEGPEEARRSIKLQKQILNGHNIVSSSSTACYLFLAMRDKKFSGNSFGNKEHKEMVLGPEQEEWVPGYYEESSQVLIGQ